MAEQARPEGIAGLTLAGPLPGRRVRRASSRRSCASAPACSSSARSGTCARSARRSTSSCATATARVPCAMWRDAFDGARARATGALADGAQVVVAGGPDYYPGPRQPRRVLLRRHRPADRRRGRPARPARARCAARSTPRGCSSRRRRSPRPRAAAHDRRRHRRGRQGARRRARGAAPPRLGRAARLGVRPGAGPPRRARDRRARCRTSRRCRGGRGRRSSPAAAARWPTCSPSATRRCAARSRCCACRSSRRSATTPTARCIDDVAAVSCSTPTHAAEAAVPLHCGEAREALGARAGALRTHGAPRGRSTARACSRGSRARPAEHVARHRRALHQDLRELRASARAARRGRARA